MIAINTKLTVANKTDSLQQLVLIDSNELESEGLHIKMKSRTLDIEPSSITTHDLEVENPRMMIGVVNKDVTLDSPIGMLKEIEFDSDSCATIIINTNKSIGTK